MTDEILMANIGFWEVALVTVVVILVFGPRRIGEVFKSFKKGAEELKSAATEEEPKEKPKDKSVEEKKSNGD
jgi:TatA/E family protein of Tat protein translocase